jgi:hypothetical protein
MNVPQNAHFHTTLARQKNGSLARFAPALKLASLDKHFYFSYTIIYATLFTDAIRESMFVTKLIKLCESEFVNCKNDLSKFSGAV